MRRTLLQRHKLLVVLLFLFLSACATSPLGRSQVKLFSDSDMREMGEAAFLQLRQTVPESNSATINNYVDCIAMAVTAVPEARGVTWEVVVFDDEQANAFALPGGKIGVYTGMLDVAKNQHQLAAVMAHEVSHVIADHANERVSRLALTDIGLQPAAVISGSPGPKRDRLLAALGLGAQVGMLLPFSRKQEEEADLVGMDLMARAGFDPAESIELWRNMARQSGGAPPEFLSTHPSSSSRIDALESRLGSAKMIYAASTTRPNCAQ